MNVRERNRGETREEKSWKSRTWRKWRKHDYLECREERRGESLLKEREEKQRRRPGLACSSDKRGKTLKGSKKGEFQLPWIVVNVPRGQRKGVELEAGLNYEEKWFLRQGEATWKAKTPEPVSLANRPKPLSLRFYPCRCWPQALWPSRFGRRACIWREVSWWFLPWPPREGQRLYTRWSVLGQDVIFEGIEVGMICLSVFFGWM